MRYHAFVSYSHAADGDLGRVLQASLQKFAKPFYRTRAISVFRDKTDMSANPALWPKIQEAMRESEFLLLLASPLAARSPWVRREIDYWLELHNDSTDRMLIVWTGGMLAWDDRAGDFDWSSTDALADNLKGRFTTVPFYLDERWAHSDDSTDLSLRDPRFLDDVATLAATLHGKSKSEMIGAEVDEHRRYLRVRNLVATLLVVLAIGTSVAAYFAYAKRNEAIDALVRETAAREEAVTQRGLAEERQREAERQKAIAEENEARSRRNLYAVHMNVVQQALRVGNLEGADDLLRLHIPQAATDTDLRGFEWYYLWRLFHREKQSLPHAHQVWDVRFSPNGRQIASMSASESGSPDTTLNLWDAGTGRQIRSIKVGGSHAHSFAYSDDGKMLVTVDPGYEPDASLLRVWDAEGKSGQQPLKVPLPSIASMAFVPRSHTLALIERGQRRYNSRLILFDIDRRELVLDTRGGMDQPEEIAVSPDGRLIAVRGNLQVNLIDRESGTVSQRIAANFNHSMCFSPDGKILALGMLKGEIKLHDPATGQERGEIAGHRDSLNSFTSTSALACSSDGQRIASGSWDRGIRVWDVTTKKQLYGMSGHRNYVDAVAFSPDGRTLASASSDGTVKVWGAEPEPAVLPFRLGAQTIAFLPDRRTLALHVYDMAPDGVPRGSFLNLIDLSTGRSIKKLATRGSGSMAEPSFTLSSDGSVLAWGQEDGIVALWDVARGRKTGELRGLNLGERISSGVVSLAFSPDGSKLAAANSNHYFHLWEVKTGKVLRSSGLNTVSAVSYSPDGRALCQLTFDSGVECRDPASWSLLAAFKASGHLFGVPVFSPDGQRLAASATITSRSAGHPDSIEPDQFVVKMWNFASGTELATLRGHLQKIGTPAFSPDGRTLATGSGDGIVKLWSVTSGQEVATLRVRDEAFPVNVAFSPDGRFLATAALYEVKLWQAASAADVVAAPRQLSATASP